MVLKILALGGLQFIYLLIYLFIYLFIYFFFWGGGLILTACHEPTVIVVWKSVLLP